LKRLILLTFILLYTQFIGGQVISIDNTIVISGKVIDADTSQPLEYATIALLRTGQEKITGTTTDKNGAFEIQVDAGIYSIKIDFLSYETYALKSKVITENLDIGVISLKSGTILDEVEVTAEKKLVEFGINKKVYNASTDIVNKGGTALDVLANTPSVRVDAEGSVTIRGGNPTILIDGKPQFNLDNNYNFLKSFPSNSIDKVEIITRTAKYSSSGGAILNIITKKIKTQGYNASFEAHTGLPDNHGASIFLNTKTDKVNLFSTISFNNIERQKTVAIEQPQLNLFQESEEDRNRNNLLFNVGSDFYLNSNSTLTASFLFNSSNKNNLYNIASDDFDRNTNESDDFSKIELQLGYTLELDKKGQKIKLNLSYENTDSENDSEIIEKPKPITSNISQEYTKQQQLNNYLAQLDYTLPITKNSNLELGYKGTFRDFKNDYKVFQFDATTGTNNVLENLDDIFSYNEIVHGIYGLYSSSNDKLSYSIGLRTEISDITIKEENNTSKVDKNFTDLFPSLTVGYLINDNSYISLNYNRSIERPLIPQLNPFIYYAYQRFQSIGNPNLNSYYTNYYELLFDTAINKTTISFAWFLNNQQNQHLSILENSGLQTANGNEIFKRKFINSGDKDIIGLDLDVTIKPFKGLRLNGYVSPYQLEITNAIDPSYNFKSTVWYAEGSALISLNNGLKFNISHKYQSPIVNGLTELRTINFTNLTFSKDLFNKNGTITFKAIDIFKTKQFNYVSLEANTLTRHNVFYQNQYNLSFAYRFNQKRRNKNKKREIN